MPPSAEKRIAELDGLRGFAIALVLWHHLLSPYLPPGAAHWLGWVQAAGNLAWCGVDLFFVLSGFFIGGILIDRRESPRLTRVFYVRRALRILPLCFFTLAVSLALVGTRLGTTPPDFSPWVYGLFLTNFALALQNHWDGFMMSVLWSLAVEEQFYLIAPWVVRAISPRRLPVLLLALIIGASVLRSVFSWSHPDLRIAIHVLTPLRMDALALGALVAWVVRTPAARPSLERLRITWPFWLSGAMALLAALTANRSEPGTPLQAHLGYTLIAVCFALLVTIVVAVRPTGLCRLLAFAPLAHLGRHSYFIYLWHILIGLNIITWLGGHEFLLDSPIGFGVVLLAITATWTAAIISWKYFEAPLLRLGHRTGY